MFNGNVFAPITDVRKNEDGSRTLFGLISDEAVDADNQIADLGWVRSQMPDYMRWANVREMHAPKAVGVANKIEDKGDSIWMEALVIDTEAVRKVDAGVYKGFSIGIKGTPINPYKVVKDAGARGGRIVGGSIIEVSLCDRPANPNAVFSVVKNTELINEEQSNIEKLKTAAGLIAEVTGDLPVHTATEPVENLSYEDAVKSVLTSLGLVQPVVVEDEETVEIDKTMIAEVVKTMTAEERKEIGLITAEDLDALKTSMAPTVTAEQFEGLQTSLTDLTASVAEMGKKIVPTTVKTDGAIPMIAQSAELTTLREEEADLVKMIETAPTSMREFANTKLVETRRAIAAFSTPEA